MHRLTLLPGLQTLLLTGILLLGGSGVMKAQEVMEETRYARAERLLSWHLDPLIAGDEVRPDWMRGGNRFWYRNKTGEGHEFILVDPEQNLQAPLFDHARLAAVMSEANDTSYIGRKLPFDDFEFTDEEEATIAFRVGEKRFECDIRDYACTVGDTLPSHVPFVESPNGEWEAFVHEDNLYVRPVAESADSVQLTTDGEKEWAYGHMAWGRVSREDRPQRPILQWSPDSRKIAVQKTDVRGVGKMPLYSSTKQRPEYYLYPYALPGDSILPRFDIHIVELDSRANHRVEMPPQPTIVHGVTGLSDSTWVTVKWTRSSDGLYFTHGVRGSKRIQLMRTDLSGQEPALLAKDTAATWVELRHGGRSPPNWAVANEGEDIIWFSQRDGWAHLYRFGSDGEPKNRITSGTFTVDRIHHVDDANDRIYFTAWGSGEGMPYHRHLYRIGLDGSGMTLLTPEGADHEVSFTPSGRFFVDQYSTITDPPVTVLRRVPDGRVVRTLEEADISGILEVGWAPREVFKVKARDGVTDLYGVLTKPSDFDPEKRYPVIEYIYPGPQVGSVGSWGFSAGGRGDVTALAELGFLVVQLDHLGTPWRSKAFHDHYYGNMGDNGLPDHMAALRQLAAQRPYMDLERVGIYGHSGGGFASTDAILRYPDFYKVAVSGSGNHDNRTYFYGWGEKYQGLYQKDTVKGTDNYENQANYLLAENLKGKLFLLHGDLDDNVHPAMTIRVADALIKANKSFDFLLVPDRHHGLNEPYVVRRRWDYFVEHLLGMTPPRDYEVHRPDEGPGGGP